MSKVKCGFCKEYVEKEEAVRTGVQSFCTTQHQMQAAFEASRIRSKRKSEDASPELKAAVRQLDGNKCRFCGARDNLHVHHVRYRSEGGKHEASNLLTLCTRHHDIVHSNKGVYQPLCLEIINLRDKGDMFVTISMLQSRQEKI